MLALIVMVSESGIVFVSLLSRVRENVSTEREIDPLPEALMVSEMETSDVLVSACVSVVEILCETLEEIVAVSNRATDSLRLNELLGVALSVKVGVKIRVAVVDNDTDTVSGTSSEAVGVSLAVAVLVGI
jgi:hypothetical protein